MRQIGNARWILNKNFYKKFTTNLDATKFKEFVSYNRNLISDNPAKYKSFDDSEKQYLSERFLVEEYLGRNPYKQVLTTHSPPVSTDSRIFVLDELLTIFNFLVPIQKRKDIEQEEKAKLWEKWQKRKLDIQEGKIPRIDAVFISDAPKWEEQIQVMCDLVTTQDGHIGEKLLYDGIQIPYLWFPDTDQMYVAFEVCIDLLYRQKPANQIKITNYVDALADISSDKFFYVGNSSFTHSFITQKSEKDFLNAFEKEQINANYVLQLRNGQTR